MRRKIVQAVPAQGDDFPVYKPRDGFQEEDLRQLVETKKSQVDCLDEQPKEICQFMVDLMDGKYEEKPNNLISWIALNPTEVMNPEHFIDKMNALCKLTNFNQVWTEFEKIV